MKYHFYLILLKLLIAAEHWAANFAAKVKYWRIVIWINWIQSTACTPEEKIEMLSRIVK